MQQEDRSAKLVEDQPPGNLPYLKPDDVQYFDKLLVSLSAQNKILSSLMCRSFLNMQLAFYSRSMGI